MKEAAWPFLLPSFSEPFTELPEALCWHRASRGSQPLWPVQPLRGGPMEGFANISGKQVAVTNDDESVPWAWICHTFLYSKTPAS